MEVKDLVDRLSLSVLSGKGLLEREISGGYASDLLSNVMGHLDEGMIWITMQVHQNVVAVASLKEASAVLLANGACPDAATIEKAEEENVVLLVTSLPAFDACGKVYRLLGRE